jgi:hypothetical protein
VRLDVIQPYRMGAIEDIEGLSRQGFSDVGSRAP